MEGSCAPETRIVPIRLNMMDRIFTLLNLSLKINLLKMAVIAGEEKANTVATAAPLY